MTAPVDAAPPKDPMTEIEEHLDAYRAAVLTAEREGNDVITESFYDDEADRARASLLSAFASLRARAERAEDSDAESIAMYRRARDRAEAAESSLARLREMVAGLEEMLDRGELCLQCSETLRSALRSLDSSPSTPETKDDHR